MHKEEPRWLLAPPQKHLKLPFLKGIPIKALENEKVEYQAETDKGKIRLIANLKDTFQMSKGQLHADMCEMNILNEPQILRNLIDRYKKDEIFTYIGPTLIVVNPYKLIERHFNNRTLTEIRDSVLAGNTKGLPHIFFLAGRAFQGLASGEGKQAIVISGQSGAGKTESTKYCMKIITSLNAKQKNHSIENKILACNPLLQAFGNSKTIRNDNSSRFGKYVQIYFGSDNTIKGANIISYLLEKSRVVSVAQNERTFHAFYTLTSSGKYGTKQASKYAFLHQSGTYTASNIDDAKYFVEINKSMEEIGFTEGEQSLIWQLVWCILELGNTQFKDEKHYANEAEPCQIHGTCDLKKVSKILKVTEADLKKIILFEKKVFKNENAVFKAFNRNGCIANRNTLCKAIYNSIFEFIIYKIQKALNPHTNQPLNSINLLDIFGFQNFGQNSLEQLCINFTNEKLLKTYNRYVFENEMVILRQDGLQKEIKDINPPTNDNVIALLSGKLSLFSIINDNTPNVQFKDQDMMSGFHRDFSKNQLIRFDLIKKKNFTIVHSQCEVTYNIQGFKFKNQDKVSADIEEIYTKLFVNQNKNQVGKTLLKKFEKEIEDLVTELSSAANHFVRCIKPNQQKMPNRVDSQYMLTQVRYLGVFETIQIRQKTFPARKIYSDFVSTFQPIFKAAKGKSGKELIHKILSQVKAKEKDYLLGTKRIYMNKELQDKLNKQVYNFFKVKNQNALKIQKAYKKYRMRKILKRLAKRNIILKKIIAKSIIKQIAQKYFIKCEEIRKKQQAQMMEKLKEKQKKQLQKMKSEKELQQRLKMAKQSKKQLKIQVEPQKVKQQVPVDNTNVSLKGMLGEQSVSDISMVIDTPEKTYKRLQRPIEKEEFEGKFDVSFSGQKSVYISDSPDFVFQNTLQLPFFQGSGGNFEKLQRILSEQYKLEVTGNEEQFFSPNSEDCNFKIQDTPPELLNKIIHFNLDQFFKKVLRKRTTFIGMSKDYKDILVAKNRPINKTLTLMGDLDEDKALKVFKVIVRIGQQAKLDNVFRLIENMISLCQSTTQELKNEVFLQLVKQSYTSHELAAIRIYQSLAVYLHIYIPDQDFLMAVLSLFNRRLHQGKSSEKQQDYLRYLFKKMIRKIQNPPVIGYMPIKYQMMALMCKRQISIPVYLPIGNSILIRVQSYDTFADIKERVIEQFGINSQRIRPQMFRFFQIVNFENEQLEQSPINEGQIVWDIMTYWQLAKQKYKEANSPPPAFFLMLKIVYCFQVMPGDDEAIEICFAQCYFDYFIGRIRLQFDYMAALAACVKKIKLPNRPEHQILGSYPIWMAKKYDKKQLIDAMVQNLRQMEKEGLDLIRMKYRFLQISDKCPLAMAMAIPTEQPVKLYFKPKKIYLTEKSQIKEQFSMRTIIKWAIDKQKFVFDVKGNSSHVVFTQYAYICSQFLSDLPKLLKKKG